MTGRVVERAARTAYRSVSVPFTGVSALMPPHSQGAERRPGHHAGRTGSRWGLRVLVVGGLAGAAWLLTGAAAHAADRDPAGEGVSLGSSLIGSAVLGDSTGARPADRVSPVPLHHTGADPAPSGIDSVVRELTATLHLPGEAVDTRKPVPVTDPPEFDPPRAVTAPALPAQPAAPRVSGTGDSGTAARGVVEARSAVDPVTTGRTVADQVGEVGATGTNGRVVDRDSKVPAAGHEPDRRHQVGRTVARQHPFAADRHPAAATAAEPETVSDTPGGDAPAPLRVHLGAANGVPAPGAPTATEGGSAAFLPVRVTDSAVALHRLSIAADVEVRRHDAEAPTVSPD